MLVGYGPNEGDDEERERFCNDLDRIVNKVWNGYILCVLGDLNGCVGDQVRAGITGASGIPGENDNRRRVVEFFAVRGAVCG